MYNYGDIVLNGSSSLDINGWLYNYGDIALRDDASFLNDYYFYNGVNGNLKLEDRAIFENQVLVDNCACASLDPGTPCPHTHLR